ncbi:unnamed protein product (macronuclear) [Paramecium tetraurelia]|uniref:Protein kinase domain-containing protein n=1 Tax=Paramecium tetraurelia TaxID=5888 RepID=A0D063_PARTE|nr:uncharacterized protein GSPATT00011982001 [Paramecium tetraurelia]CAK76430.1 unnamed protein product [Paramecium tetraurelia]|eukprot:XP_001443827.1 hypothetical protein (macronuclear) [Paramecium tetraurelia strain d4-2]
MLQSIFDFGQTTSTFWKQCDKALLDEQNELLEHEFLVGSKERLIKKKFLVMSQDSLFRVSLSNLKKAPLLTMHVQFIEASTDNFVQLNSDEQLLGFHLSYQGKSLEIFTADKISYDIWKSHFKRFAILDNFHEAFQVSKMIGKGSFAKVYQATKKETNTQYAIKAFSKAYMQQQAKGIESMLNEIKIMRRLNHPNIVKLYEVHETTNSIYFVLDMIQGGELLQRVRETGFLPAETVQKLAFNLVSALSHMHENRVIHRDLKPENLLLRSTENNYEIILADFGLATNLDEEHLFKRCGTPGFVAPEILEYVEGQEFYTDKCDVFSAGIILYLLITGNTPFIGVDQKSILKNNKECEIDFKEPHFKLAPIQMQDLIQSMLQKKVSYRLSSQECMRHPYFKQLVKEYKVQIEKYQSNLQCYQEIQNARKIGTQDLEQRSPLNFNSSDSISSNISQNRQDQRKTSIVAGASKFSQYSARLSKQNSREISDIPLKQEQKKSKDLHRLALTNSQLKQIAFNQFDNVEDPTAEDCNVGVMVRQYNSTRQIRIPDNTLQIKECNTPTMQKQQ